MTLQRALTPPATGYRFPAFAPHFQDYEPSEVRFAMQVERLEQVFRVTHQVVQNPLARPKRNFCLKVNRRFCTS